MELRAQAAAPLIAQLKAMQDPDAALARVKELYDADLISSTDRNTLRDAVLAAE